MIERKLPRFDRIGRRSGRRIVEIDLHLGELRQALDAAGRSDKNFSIYLSLNERPDLDMFHRFIDAGVTAVIQPGGSVRDDEVVAAADQRGVAMILTGERHFRH